VTGIPVSGNPEGLALSSDGTTLYVTESNGVVETIATSTDVVSTFATLSTHALAAADLTPNGADLVVAGSDAGFNGTVWVVSTATGDVVSQSTVGQFPWAVAVSPTGKVAYLANNGSGTTSVVTLVSAKPKLTVDKAPTSATTGVAIAPVQFGATGYPSPRYSITAPLPDGLTLNAVSGILSGTPTAVGVFTFKVIASNGVSPASTGVTHTITVLNALTTAVPTITGTAKSGQVLTAVPGKWGPGTVKFTHVWERYSGGTWKKISKATKATYKLTSSDHKHKVRVVVTGSETTYRAATVASASLSIS
jgi:hypothetical protein